MPARTALEVCPSRFTRFAALAALCLAFGLAFVLAGTSALAQTKSKSKSKAGATRSAHPATSSAPATNAAEQTLEKLAHALHDEPTGIQYQRLSEFATSHAATPLGQRAALALG